MSRKFRGRQAGVLAVAAALASLGGIDVMLVTSGGAPAPRLVVPVAAEATPVAASQVSASPPQAGSAALPSAPATASAPPPVVEKPPPVVDGVRRVNVGSAHSPKLTQQLATSPPTMPSPADAGALGVDVADYQHPHGAAIGWSQVAAAGYRFAFIKGTEGDYYANPYHAYDLAQAKAVGLYATGYHFAIPNVSDGASQADYAVANGGYAADGRTLPLALDIEYNPYGAECYGLSTGQMVSWLAAFTAEQQRLTGQLPIIYTTADWWDTCTGGSTAFGSDPLWVAGYTSGSPPMPAGWGNWTFWQYTSRGSIPGITGHVDVSYFLRAAGSISSLTTATPSQPAPSQPAPPLTQPPTASSSPFLLPPAGSPSPADTASASPADTVPASPSDSPSPTDSASPSPSSSPTPTVSPSTSACASPSVSPSPSPTESPSPAASACTCASPSASASPSDSPSPSGSPSPSPSDAACTSPSPSDPASPTASP